MFSIPGINFGNIMGGGGSGGSGGVSIPGINFGNIDAGGGPAPSISGINFGNITNVGPSQPAPVAVAQPSCPVEKPCPKPPKALPAKCAPQPPPAKCVPAQPAPVKCVPAQPQPCQPVPVQACAPKGPSKGMCGCANRGNPQQYAQAIGQAVSYGNPQASVGGLSMDQLVPVLANLFTLLQGYIGMSSQQAQTPVRYYA